MGYAKVIRKRNRLENLVLLIQGMKFDVLKSQTPYPLFRSSDACLEKFPTVGLRQRWKPPLRLLSVSLCLCVR